MRLYPHLTYRTWALSSSSHAALFLMACLIKERERGGGGAFERRERFYYGGPMLNRTCGTDNKLKYFSYFY